MVPIYPNAQTVRFQQKTPDTRIVTFQTKDAISDICSWYKQTLAREHWLLPQCQPSDNGFTTSSEWVQSDLNGPTGVGYKFTLWASHTGDANTDVRVEVARFLPR